MALDRHRLTLEMLLKSLLLAAALTGSSSASHLSYEEETSLLRAGLPQVGLYQAIVNDRTRQAADSFIAGSDTE